MPTDPPSANQTNPPGPLGQAQPPAHLPQHRLPYQFPQQPQPNYPIHPSQQGRPQHPQHLQHPQNPQYQQHPQYALSGQPPLHSLQQPPAQRQSPRNHQQQPRAPMNQPSQLFTGGAYQQHIGSYPNQQFPMNPYMYTGPTPYPYQMPGPNAMQPQPGVNARAKRNFMQPAAASSTQRPPTRSIPVPPPRKKNILQIVDPDTNEEVKVSKVETRPAPKPAAPSPPTHPPVKIPPRRSHALELVSDPADDKKHASESPKQSVETTSQQSVPETNVDLTSLSVPCKAEVAPTTLSENELSEKSVLQSDGKASLSHVDKSKETVQENIAEAKHSPAPEGTHPTLTSSADQTTLTSDEPAEKTGARTEVASAKVPSPIIDDSDPTHPSPTESNDSKQTEVKRDASTPKPGESLKKNSVSLLIKSTKPIGRIEDAPMTCPLRGVHAKKDNEAPSSPSVVSTSSTTAFDEATRHEQKQVSDADAAVEGKESLLESSQTREHPAESIPIEEERHEASSTSVQEKEPLERSLPDTFTASEGQPVSETSTEVNASNANDDEKEPSASVENDDSVFAPSPILEEGQRLVYVPTFMWDMKSKPNSKKATEYEAALGSRDILKNAPTSNFRRNDSRANRSSRGAAGPLSTDPRRAFPGQGGSGFQMVPTRGTAPPGIGGVGVTSYDAFDLSSARSQAPPPAPKSQSSVRDGDPRGTRQHGSRGRFDGPTRHGQGPIDPFVMHPPVEKLKRTDKGWKRNREADDEITAKVKAVRSLLNKLTLEKFDKIFKQIVDVGISSFEVLDGIVTEIFEKTLFEPKFSGMYAELCRRLEGSLHEVLTKANFVDADGKAITFRRILVNHCRDEFTRFAQSDGQPKTGDGGTQTEEAEQKEEAAADETLSPEEKTAKEKQKKEAEAETAVKAKRRMLANVKFIGELFIKDLLKQQVIHKQCIQKLLKLGIEKKEEDVLEALCKLLSKTGAKLSESKEANHYIDKYFEPLKLFSMDSSLPARIRFMIQDLIEQRANNWKVRREEAGAKTIAEIHKDIEKEERAKQEAQAAARERRHRGGMHGRDRGQQNFAPRVPMTMASSRRSAANVSRTNSVIEKFGNRGAAPTSTSNYQSVRLMPGGARSMGAGSGGSGSLRPGSGPGSLRPGSGSGSLRPGSGSGFGMFGALTDNRDSGMNGQSDDVRKQKGRRAPARPTMLPPDKLKQRVSSTVKEFWSLGSLSEVREVMAEEVPKPNYSAFVEELIRISIDAKVDESEKSLGLIRDLAVEPLPGTDLVTGFSTLLSQVADLEIDNPRVSEFLGRYIGAVASTRKLPEGDSPSFGLTFVRRAISETEDPKRIAKLYISIFSALQKELTSSTPNDKDRIRILKDAYGSLDVDLAGFMNAWNPMRGLTSLEDMLKSSNLSFLSPHIKMEQELKAVLQGSPSGNDVLEIFKTCVSPDESFLRAVVRQSLDWALMSPVDNVKESFSGIIGTSLTKAFDTKFTAEAQMSGLLEAQFFVTRNLEILPAKQVGSLDKPGAIAFNLLYDAEMVSRDTLLRWKEDTGRSVRVLGKDKMVMQTSQFFQWLVQLQH